jgi:hypothetical protein
MDTISTLGKMALSSAKDADEYNDQRSASKMTREENALIKKLGTLYEFTEQGAINVKEEYARAAFLLLKRRIEVLFPEFFEVVKEPSKEELQAEEFYAKLERF